MKYRHILIHHDPEGLYQLHYVYYILRKNFFSRVVTLEEFNLGDDDSSESTYVFVMGSGWKEAIKRACAAGIPEGNCWAIRKFSDDSYPRLLWPHQLSLYLKGLRDTYSFQTLHEWKGADKVAAGHFAAPFDPIFDDLLEFQHHTIWCVYDQYRPETKVIDVYILEADDELEISANPRRGLKLYVYYYDPKTIGIAAEDYRVNINDKNRAPCGRQLTFEDAAAPLDLTWNSTFFLTQRACYGRTFKIEKRAFARRCLVVVSEF